jgi:hypothetical protein
LKQISVMHHIYNISEKYHLQEKRQEIVWAVKIMPPYTSLSPEIYTRLIDGTNKSSDPVNTMNAARLTINTYPDDWIHVCTDGSACKATVNAGYGILIH